MFEESDIGREESYALQASRRRGSSLQHSVEESKTGDSRRMSFEDQSEEVLSKALSEVSEELKSAFLSV